MKPYVFLTVLLIHIFLFANLSLNTNETIPIITTQNPHFTHSCPTLTATNNVADCPKLTGFYSPYLSDYKADVSLAFIKNTDSLPNSFIQNCLENSLIPYIVIEPDRTPFDLRLIEALAKELSYYDTKAIVELYPLYSKPAYGSSAYRCFFGEASQIFKKYAPKTQIVWAISPDLVYEETDFAPSEGSADFLGISLIYGLNGSKTLIYRQDILDYLTFNYSLPIIITRLSVTDYSEKNHSYYKNHKAPYISQAISDLPSAYPQICGIIAYETDSYTYENSKNKLRFSNDPSALAAFAENIEKFKKTPVFSLKNVIK